jgi:nucleotide-binding universal stress UspA family protein
MKTIVLGYDDTVPAKHALERTAELAQSFQAKVIVVSVAPVLVPAGHGIGPIYPAEPPELHEEQLEHARVLLRERGVEVESHATLGNPAEMILDVAEARHADLIVVGTREVGLIRRLLGQSVSGAVERRAHCDVLVVH